MTPANDSGPPRYLAKEAVDTRDLQGVFGLHEDTVRQLCLEHHDELFAAVRAAARDAFEQIAYREGVIGLIPTELPFDHIAWR